MKFNWGHGITLTLILFGALMFTMVYKSSQQRIDLVTEDYYNTEDAYQKRMHRKQRGQALAGTFEVARNANGIQIILPDGLESSMIEGTVYFYNPTDKRLDFERPLQAQQHLQQVEMPEIAGGRWTVKVDIPGDSGYYFEQNIFL